MFHARSLFRVKWSNHFLSFRITTKTITAWKCKRYSTTSKDTNSKNPPRSTRNGTKMNDQFNDKINLRLAREDDFQNVLKLSEGIYGDGDYIPIVFHDWLKIPNKLLFLAELHGKVVGLNVANMVSDGKTVFTQGLRIHPEHQLQRLSYQIMLGITDYVRQMCPQVCKNHFIAYESINEMIKIGNRLGYKIITKLNSHLLDIKQHADLLPLFNYRCQMLSESGLDLFPYDESAASAIVTSRNSLDIIAPQRMLFRERGPYEAIPSNIKYIFRENDKMFSDVSKEELKQGKIPRSFSHGCLAPQVDFWMCTVYTNDLDLFRAHVLRQLKSATEIIGKDFKFSLEVYSKISSFDEKKVLEEELLSLKQSSIIESDTPLLFEKEFED